jgi:hypothetical protein
MAGVGGFEIALGFGRRRWVWLCDEMMSTGGASLGIGRKLLDEYADRERLCFG